MSGTSNLHGLSFDLLSARFPSFMQFLPYPDISVPLPDLRGQVRINDIEWMARTSSDEVTIPEHAIVTIEDVQGVKLIVKEETEGK